MNIFMMIFIILGGTVGIGITAFLTLSIPVIIVWKIYRKARFHMGLFD